MFQSAPCLLMVSENLPADALSTSCCVREIFFSPHFSFLHSSPNAPCRSPGGSK